MNTPKRIFLDTNVFINAEAYPQSDCDKILTLLGLHNGLRIIDSVVIISPELVDQILRVGKRIWLNKDRVSKLLGKIWSNLTYDYIILNNQHLQTIIKIKQQNIIPSAESEEFHKNLIANFFVNTYYNNKYFINTKKRNDFVIHHGKDAKSSVCVILEAKKTSQKLIKICLR